MKEKNIEGTVESRVCFQELEDWVREKVQSWVQELLALRAVRKRNASSGFSRSGAEAEAWLRRPICWTRTGIGW